jgi:hypothetical protein
MEIILNLAWAACSLALLGFWMCAGESDTASRKTQLLALAMVVVLLLPVISLSDDLMAMQGPAETDTCLRRTFHVDEGHPPVVPHALALPEELFTVLSIGVPSQLALKTYSLVPPATFRTRSLDSRPPPRA